MGATDTERWWSSNRFVFGVPSSTERARVRYLFSLGWFEVSDFGFIGDAYRCETNVVLCFCRASSSNCAELNSLRPILDRAGLKLSRIGCLL